MDIMEENLSIYIFSWKAHMGQIPQDGENGQNVAFFHFFWSSAVTKRFEEPKKGKSSKYNFQDDGYIGSGPAVHV